MSIEIWNKHGKYKPVAQMFSNYLFGLDTDNALLKI